MLGALGGYISGNSNAAKWIAKCRNEEERMELVRSLLGRKTPHFSEWPGENEEVEAVVFPDDSTLDCGINHFQRWIWKKDLAPGQGGAPEIRMT